MSYADKSCFQHIRIFESFDVLAQALGKSARVVEIGTASGGFTHFLRHHDISEGCEVVSFDLGVQCGRCPPIPGVELVVGDCFGDQRKRIQDLCQAPGQTLLFCDGGAKEREVTEFCSFLKSGDVVLCHDYVKDASLLQDAELFDEWTTTKSHGWDGMESQWSHLAPVLTQNGFVPFCERPMQLAFWGCFRRI